MLHNRRHSCDSGYGCGCLESCHLAGRISTRILETLKLPLVATSFKGFIFFAICFSHAHLPVQYAAPWEKNTEMSDPISPDHSSSSAFVAGWSVSRLAAHSAVAALPLPPPRPAPVFCGHRDRVDEDERAE